MVYAYDEYWGNCVTPRCPTPQLQGTDNDRYHCFHLRPRGLRSSYRIDLESFPHVLGYIQQNFAPSDRGPFHVRGPPSDLSKARRLTFCNAQPNMVPQPFCLTFVHTRIWCSFRRRLAYRHNPDSFLDVRSYNIPHSDIPVPPPFYWPTPDDTVNDPRMDLTGLPYYVEWDRRFIDSSLATGTSCNPYHHCRDYLSISGLPHIHPLV